MDIKETIQAISLAQQMEESLLRFFAVKQQMVTLVSFRLKEFKLLSLVQVVVKDRYIVKKYLDQLQKLLKSIDEDAFLSEYVNGKGKRFPIDLKRIRIETFKADPSDAVLQTESALEVFKESALDVFSFLNAVRHEMCFREKKQSPIAKTETQIGILTDTIQVLDNVRHAENYKVFQAAYKYICNT